MPSNSGQPFILGVIMFILGFSLVFSWFIPAIIAGVGVIIMLAVRSFERDHGYHISAKEIAATEQKLRGDTV
jgi:cytochrome aa3-600 menaquinol oxidase subunit 1